MKLNVLFVGYFVLTCQPLFADSSKTFSMNNWKPLANEPSRSELQRFHMAVEVDAVPRSFRFPEDTMDTKKAQKYTE